MMPLLKPLTLKTQTVMKSFIIKCRNNCFSNTCRCRNQIPIMSVYFSFCSKIIAAFDYKAFKEKNPRARLLFVAHRKEIHEQSIQKFQEVLNDFNFGELYVDGYKPTDIEHLFISIQSFLIRISCCMVEFIHYDKVIIVLACPLRKLCRIE